MEKLIKKGAEAEIWMKEWMGIPAVFKVRKPRGYMIPELDEELRKQRTIKEAKMLVEARRAGVDTPTLYFVDLFRHSIIMEYIKGRSLKQLLKDQLYTKETCSKLGRVLASLHSAGIVHGDPTTSNFILSKGRLYVLDFGLSAHSDDIEDKAVDLHLVKEILSADLPEKYEAAFNNILKGYIHMLGGKAEAVVKRSRAIELRGRYARGQWG